MTNILLPRAGWMALLFASPLVAGPSAVQADVQPNISVAIQTDAGRILLTLDKAHAPATTANFLRYVDNHRFDGESFYRAMKMGDGGLIQGGIRSDSRKLYPPVIHEPTNETGLHNVSGAIAMANAGPGTAQSDFFILLSDTPAFDAANPDGDANGFAVFGKVTEGMDVVRKILESPVSGIKGEGAMKGQMLEPPVTIVTMSRVK